MKKSLIEEISKSLEAGNEVGFSDRREEGGCLIVHGVEGEFKTDLEEWAKNEPRFWYVRPWGYIPIDVDAKFLTRKDKIIMLYAEYEVLESYLRKEYGTEIKNMFSEPIDIDICNFKGEGRYFVKKGVVYSSIFNFQACRENKSLEVKSLQDEGDKLNKLVIDTLNFTSFDTPRHVLEVWWQLNANGEWSAGRIEWEEEIIEPD
jgi:hypothetical protein